jgi:integrase
MSGLDRNELGAFLVQAGLSGARDHALACLLSLNGLRVSEAIGTHVDDLGLERGHHTLQIMRNGGSTVIVPLAPRTARTVYLAIGERDMGPIFVADSGARMNRIGQHITDIQVSDKTPREQTLGTGAVAQTAPG